MTYYFAIKATDDWPLTSAISNVLAVPMPAPDTFGPTAITDLQSIGAQSSTIHLRWTAPADVGSAGMLGYEIRYSTGPISEANWASATVAVNPPAVATPGTTVNMAVKGLVGSTTYHFAVKSFDWAEPANWSAISNVVSDTTCAPILPVVLHNPWIVNDRVADTRSLATLAATFGNAYTPDGVIVPSPTDIQTDRHQLSTTTSSAASTTGATIRPSAATSSATSTSTATRCAAGRPPRTPASWQAMGIRVRTGSIANGAHTLYEVFWDNDWHLMDTMTTMYVFDRANPPSIASAADIKADKTLMTSAVAEGRACPGFLLCPDDVTWFANGTNKWAVIGEPGSTPVTHSMNMDLRYGETLDRTWNAWQNQHPTPVTDADSGNIPGPDAPYHHDAHNDWKD